MAEREVRATANGRDDPIELLLERQREIIAASQKLVLAQARFWETFSSVLRDSGALLARLSECLEAGAELYAALGGVHREKRQAPPSPLRQPTE
jgi:hypothetical protein